MAGARLARPCKFRSTVGVLSRTKRAYKDWSKCPYFLSRISVLLKKRAIDLNVYFHILSYTFCWPSYPRLTSCMLLSALNSFSSGSNWFRICFLALIENVELPQCHWGQAAEMPGSWPQVATDDGLQWASHASTCAKKTHHKWRWTRINMVKIMQWKF